MSNEKTNITTTSVPSASAEQPTGNAKSKKPYKSASNRKRDIQRFEAKRRAEGEKTMAELQKELDKRLYFGFADQVKAATTQVVELVDQAKIVPVSTRGIGMFTQAIFIKLYQTLKNIPRCSVYDLYRLSLAQFEYKVLSTIRGQVKSYSNPHEMYYHPIMDIDTREVISGMPVNFGPISNIINAVGKFEYADTTYYPRLPRTDPMEPEPHLVTYGNLRTVVMALSNRATPQPVRLRFYQANPLPGAVWGPPLVAGQRRGRGQEVHQDFPLLQNPDDFMPDDYTVEDLSQDANRVRNLLNFCSRKSVKYVDCESALAFSPEAVGCQSLLMSNYYTDGLRNSDAVFDQQNFLSYADMQLPTGELNEFWTNTKLDSSHGFMGMLQLLGEIPPEGTPQEVYGIRLREHARQRLAHHWAAVSGNMLA